MAHPMGESNQGCLRVDFDRRLKLEFHGSKHVIGTCLSCEQPMTGPSTDGNLICGKCACGFDDHGQRVSWDEQRRRYARVRGRGIGWV